MGLDSMHGELKNTQKKVWVRNLDRKGWSFGLPSFDVCSFEMGRLRELDCSGYGNGPLARSCKNGSIFFLFCFVKALNLLAAFLCICSRSSLSVFYLRCIPSLKWQRLKCIFPYPHPSWHFVSLYLITRCNVNRETGVVCWHSAIWHRVVWQIVVEFRKNMLPPSSE